MISPARRRRVAVLIVLLAVLLLAASVLSLGIGVAHQSPSEVVRALADGARGLLTGAPVPADEAHTVVLDLRLPRLLLAVLVTRSIVLPMQQGRKAAECIADGDLTQPLDTSAGDEAANVR